MSTIVVSTFLTLDGVMQAPGGPDEDQSDGFPHGGWQAPHFDEAAGEIVGAWYATSTGMLLGRRTYEIFAGYWPTVGDDSPEAAMAKVLNEMPKYVASRTLSSVDWQNSHLLGDDVPAAVAKLRAEPGGELHVVGSAEFAQTLIRHDLVDEYRLMVFPLVLGTGKRLFGDGTVPGNLALVESRTTPAGAVASVYRRAGEVRYGSF
ncbi:dihydrofolate reductase family protein [Actinophytocola gossypii]|uniref:Dihydrofolate reductase n=1 Tax=Actinophytocola gossypii TaxID=2812003 RepID=A0ABT2JJ11_9PSEU|nr:dihydrofolate reductase family protein [Actinophytocola gossypii]MCT2587380.1 dihydrofolate reductase [Actinophytocola gossypii]